MVNRGLTAPGHTGHLGCPDVCRRALPLVEHLPDEFYRRIYMLLYGSYLRFESFSTVQLYYYTKGANMLTEIILKTLWQIAGGLVVAYVHDLFRQP